VRDLFPCYEVTLIPDRYTNHPWRRPQRGMTWQATLSILVKFTGKSQNAIKPYPYTTRSFELICSFTHIVAGP
jgi:hypothetical protein